MKIFIDSAEIDQIDRLVHVIDGVTTNPSLIKKAIDKAKKKNKHPDMKSYIERILRLFPYKSVSLEVTSEGYDEMVKEGINIYKLFSHVANNVYVKIPVNSSTRGNNNFDSLKAIKELSRQGIPINCTLVFTPEQALLAAKAGAKYVSPFAGRIDDYIREKNRIKYAKEDYFPAEGLVVKGRLLHDNGIVSGVDLVKKCVQILRMNNLDCKVLAASIRNTRQFREVALAGADIVTLPYHVIEELTEHHKTKEGMLNFEKDTVKEYSSLIQ